MRSIFDHCMYSLAVLAGTVSLWGQTAAPTPTAQTGKEQIALIQGQNAKAQKMNTLIKQANDAISSKNWADAVASLQELIALDSQNWQFYSGLGDSQLYLGKYQDAIQSYDKGIRSAQAILSDASLQNPTDPRTAPAKITAGTAHMLTMEGNCDLKLHRNDDAIAAYTKAAAMDPNPATAYFNLCATQYNIGNTNGALSACDRAIAADPTKADAYYIKGSLLLVESKSDSNGTVHAPIGTAEALKKYLDLAPNGLHADEVRQMLAYIGAK